MPDIIMGGSPCQGFSFAGKRLNFNDPRSRLFFDFIEVLRHYKPRFFLFENVVMEKHIEEKISALFGQIYPEYSEGDLMDEYFLRPYKINSSFLSAQHRKRLYWTNIGIDLRQLKNKNLVLQDILEEGVALRGKVKTVDSTYSKGASIKQYKNHILNRQKYKQSDLRLQVKTPIRKAILDGGGQGNIIYSDMGKSVCLGGGIRGAAANTGIYEILEGGQYTLRCLTPVECERLQTLPDNYTEGVSNSQRYKMIGNGWTVDVIVFILKFLGGV